MPRCGSAGPSSDVKPASVRSFINLAAVQIRRELIDLARHYDGPEGPGRHHASRAGSDGSEGAPGPPDAADRHGRPGPAGGLDRVPRAGRGTCRTRRRRSSISSGIRACRRPRPPTVLGVTERVVKYRWRSARLKLHESSAADCPTEDRSNREEEVTHGNRDARR